MGVVNRCDHRAYRLVWSLGVITELTGGCGICVITELTGGCDNRADRWVWSINGCDHRAYRWVWSMGVITELI